MRSAWLLLLSAACTASSPGPAPAASQSSSSPPGPSQVPAPPAPSGSFPAGFPAYAGATALCSQHVAGNTMHISFWEYASRDAPDLVAKFYGTAVGRSKIGARDLDTLSVHAAGDADVPDCGKKPGPGDQTVIVVSIATKR